MCKCETPKQTDFREERPRVLLNLHDACDSMSMLLFSASKWIPESDWNRIADALRPHLRAAGQIIEEAAAKHRAGVIEACASKQRDSEIVNPEDGVEWILDVEVQSMVHVLYPASARESKRRFPSFRSSWAQESWE
jgi:hypothetical protein